MRIALCISGQPRFIKEAFPYIKKNIIDCNESIDVFMHCWFDENEVGKRFSNTSDTTREQGNGVIESDTITLLKKLYKPINIHFEAQVDFTNRIKPEYTATRDKTNPFATFSMWESIKRCNDLKSKYETENNFVYDAVIRCRYDLKIESPVVIVGLADQTLYTSYHNPRTDIVEDILFYGKSGVLDTISLMIDQLDANFRKINRWGNESLLAVHCQTNNVTVNRNPNWKFTLARGKRTLIDTLWYFKNRIRSKLNI